MDEKYRQYRFTVDTSDATIYNNCHHTWNLRFGSMIESNSRVMMSIETIHCSTSGAYGAGQLILDPPPAMASGVIVETLQRLQAQGVSYNHGMYSCYQIRCPHVNSRYVYDTDTDIDMPLIYCGQLYLQNTNPKESYVFEVNRDICNGEFRLSIFDDIADGTTLPPQISITFILHEYRE